MIRKMAFFGIIASVLALAGCAKPELNSQCKDFGKHCSKMPINSWDYKH